MDKLKPAEIIAFHEQNKTESGYLGLALFPIVKQLGMKLEYVKGASLQPVELSVSAFDSHVKYRDVVGVTELSEKMPFFKEASKIDETLRQELLLVEMTGKESLINNVHARIFKNFSGLIESAIVTLERMAMQVVSSGYLTISQGGTAKSFDYHLDADQKMTLTGTDSWTDAVNSDPLTDISSAVDFAEEKTGVKPTIAIINKATMMLLLKNQKIKSALSGLAVSEKNVKELIEDRTGVRVAVYSKKYKNSSGVMTPFMPNNVCTLHPEGIVGETKMGTTPEEADLNTGKNENPVELYKQGIACTTFKPDNELNQVAFKVSEIAMPSGENLDKIFIINC